MTYTEKELDQFLHGISLSLLSKKSAQHWRYDEETAKEIEWLEALERKVRADKADRPQGEWIDAEIPLESGGSMPIQVCNLCKTFYPLAYTGGGHRFCPNCGARMDGEREGE